MSAPRTAITGVVLAGGQGQRMGGVDKGLVALDGQPLVAHVLARLAPQVDRVLINANRNAPRYAAFGYPVFADEIAGFAGPLAGLHAALGHAEDPLVATAPCDSPFLPPDLVARLRGGLEAAGADLAVACTLGQQHPVFCLCRRSVRAHLEAYLASGARRFDRWYASLKVAYVAFDDVPEAFCNLNTREELDRLRGR